MTSQGPPVQDKLSSPSHKSSGSPTPGRSKSNQSTQGKTAKVHWIRNFAVGLLVVTTVVLQVLVVVVLVLYRKYLYSAAERDAGLQMLLLQAEYASTLSTTQLMLQEAASSYEVTTLLRDSTVTSPQYGPVFQQLQEQSLLSSLEYVTLLRTDGSILASINNNRTNETWDPLGVISHSISVRSTVAASIVIHSAEWRAEGATEITDGTYSGRSGQGILDTGSDAFGCVTTVPVTSNGTFLGVLASIYMLNGKTTLLENTVGTSRSGFGSAYIWNGTTWIIASQLRYSSASTVDYTSAGIDLTSILNQARSSQSQITQQVTAPDGTNYVLVASPSYGSRYSKAFVNYLLNSTDAVFVRGYSLASVDASLLSSDYESICFMLGCIIFDIIGLIVSLRLFVDPLQELIMYLSLHAFEKYSKTIAKISMVKRLSLRIGFFTMISVGFLIWLAVANTNNLRDTFTQLLSAKLDYSTVSIEMEKNLHNMNAATKAFVQQQTVQQFASSPGTSNFSSQIVAQLKGDETRRKLSYATIVDTNKTIILCSNNNRLNQTFDPSGVVSFVLERNAPFMGFVSMNVSDFLLEGAPVPSANFSAEILLKPYYPMANSTTPVIVQFAATPIYVNGSKIPSGVLLYGAAANGGDFDTYALTEGFRGIVTMNPSTGVYTPISFRFYDSTAQSAGLDFWISSGRSLIPQVKSSRAIQETIVTNNGVRYSVAVWVLDSSYWEDESGNFHVIPPYVQQFHPEVYVIRAASVDLWDDLVKAQEGILIAVVCIQAISMGVSTWVLYNPVRKFLKYIDGSIAAQSGKSPKKKGSRSSDAETASIKVSDVFMKPFFSNFFTAPSTKEDAQSV